MSEHPATIIALEPFQRAGNGSPVPLPMTLRFSSKRGQDICCTQGATNVGECSCRNGGHPGDTVLNTVSQILTISDQVSKEIGRMPKRFR